MSQQGIFVFAYHRRGQTPLWDKGRGWLAKVDPSGPRRHQEIRFERVSERLVHVAVHDAEAFDTEWRTCDYNGLASLADDVFRKNLPDQFLAEPG
jgi:hypothetical protein